MRRLACALAVMLVGAGCGGFLPSAKTIPPPERATVRIGTAGELSAFLHLPLPLADRLGYFSARGLKVEFSTFTSGVAAVTALGRGDVDLVSVPYELTIRAQAAGTRLKMVALSQLRPGLMVTVGRPFVGQVNSMKDLVGKAVGVTSPGTLTETIVRLLALREGLDPASIHVTPIGVGHQNQSAITSGQVAAGVDTDPFAAEMEQDGTGKVLYETRSLEGTKAIFGGRGMYPNNGLITTPDFIARYPNTIRALVAADVRALRYIATHSADEIAARMPSDYKEGRPELYATSLKANRSVYSPDGTMPADGPGIVLRSLQLVNPSMTTGQFDLAQTYDNSFAREALSS